MLQFVLFLFFLLLSHWYLDFELQDNEMALQKSDNNKVLAKHCLIYAGPLSLAFLTLSITAGIVSFVVLFVSHFAIDYVTARMNKKFWLNNKRHEFFVMVGFDQYLHQGVLLFLTYIFWGV
jgi:hypothetical protein